MALLLHYRKLLRPGGSSYHHSSAAAGDHEHRATAAHGFIVDVDAHNGIGAPLACAVYHLLDGCVLGLNEHLLIGCRPASEKIGDTSHHVFKHIGANDGFASHHAQILLNGVALEVGSR